MHIDKINGQTIILICISHSRDTTKCSYTAVQSDVTRESGIRNQFYNFDDRLHLWVSYEAESFSPLSTMIGKSIAS